jgi:hypothetical protein
MSLKRRIVAVTPIACVLSYATLASGSPPTGPHPRMFLDAPTLAALTANAAKSGTAAASMISQCQDTIDHPTYVTDRGGVDADTWPGGAVRCAVAYLVTQKQAYLTQSIMFWHAALDDDMTLGDKLGCVQGVDANWKAWNGSSPTPPVLLTVTHDTGYPMRWYGPYLSLVYDWLHDAPGVDEALRAQTRTCMTAWMDWYTAQGFEKDMPGVNYNAGFVVGKTLAAVAIGTEGGSDGHLWNETVNDLFPRIIEGNGMSWTPAGQQLPVMGGLQGNADTQLGKPVGIMVGGDWGSWEYAPLSVAELSAASFALEKQGVALPVMDAWVNSLVTRHIYATVPTGDWVYCGEGDCGDCSPQTPGDCHINAKPSAATLDAVLLGPSSPESASWALFMKQKQQLVGSSIWNALGEARSVTPADYTTQMNVPLWYLARGTRSMYVRSSWQQDALWAVFTSAPAGLDHQHYGAGSFVLTRGSDDLIVEASPYGMMSTFETNAITADSSVVTGDYAPSQTPWSQADLLWARGTADAVYAARSDFAHAFDFDGTPSDIQYAHREWVLLPEGEVITIDRVHTSAASRSAYLSFHTNTGATLAIGSNGVASGKAGGSQVAIHPVFLSGGTPTITQPPVGDCFDKPYPYAMCQGVRVPVDDYSVKIPGDWAVAVHVIDALAAGEAQAQVGSINDDTFDPAPKQNQGVIGAAVFRAQKQSYVIASSAVNGVSPSDLTYGVPGDSPGRHIVYDAPEAADGTSAVTAKASGGRCLIDVQAGSGKGFLGQPVMFVVSAASGGCQVTETTGVGPGEPQQDGGTTPNGSGSSTGTTASGTGSGAGTTANGSGGSTTASGSGGGGPKGGSHGCGCKLTTTDESERYVPWAFMALGLMLGARSRAKRSR